MRSHFTCHGHSWILHCFLNWMRMILKIYYLKNSSLKNMKASRFLHVGSKLINVQKICSTPPNKLGTELSSSVSNMDIAMLNQPLLRQPAPLG